MLVLARIRSYELQELSRWGWGGWNFSLVVHLHRTCQIARVMCFWDLTDRHKSLHPEGSWYGSAPSARIFFQIISAGVNNQGYDFRASDLVAASKYIYVGCDPAHPPPFICWAVAVMAARSPWVAAIQDTAPPRERDHPRGPAQHRRRWAFM